MRRALLALTAALLLVAVAALAFWPGQGMVEPAAGTPATGQQDGESCDTCTLRHQRLGEPGE